MAAPINPAKVPAVYHTPPPPTLDDSSRALILSELVSPLDLKAGTAINPERVKPVVVYDGSTSTITFNGRTLDQKQIVEQLEKIDEKLRGSCNVLNLSNCKVESLEFLRLFPNITRLDLTGCYRLRSLKGIEECAKLNQLIIKNCKSLDDLATLAHTKLLVLGADGCDGISDIEGIRGLPLRTVDLSNCRGIRSLGAVLSLGDLNELYLRALPRLTNINQFNVLIKLKTIDVTDSGVPKGEIVAFSELLSKRHHE